MAPNWTSLGISQLVSCLALLGGFLGAGTFFLSESSITKWHR